MSKRILAILCTAVLLVTLIPAAIMASGTKAWELTSAEIDEIIKTNESSENLVQAGGPTKTNDGGLKVSNRAEDWNAIDLKTEGLLKDGVEYTMVVKFSAAAPAIFALKETGGYKDLAVSSEAKKEDTLTFKFKLADIGGKNIRMQTNGDKNDYTIVSAIVWEGEPGTETAATDKTDKTDTTSSDNKKTGVESFIFIALGVLALTAAGAVVFTRKAKSM